MTKEEPKYCRKSWRQIWLKYTKITRGCGVDGDRGYCTATCGVCARIEGRSGGFLGERPRCVSLRFGHVVTIRAALLSCVDEATALTRMADFTSLLTSSHLDIKVPLVP